MTTTNVALWNTVAASNSDIDGNNVTGSGQVSTADNSFRSIMSQVAKFYADLGGVNTVGGTGDVITITTSSVFTALATGLVLAFKAGAANTTDATVNVDGLGAKAIRKFTTAEAALVANDIIAGGKYLLVYDAAANAAAGAWIALNLAPAVGATTFSDSAFRVQDNGDATKQIALEASAITTGTTRTVTMPDSNVSLFPETTAAQYQANTAAKALTTDKVWSAMAVVTLTDAATITWDMSTGIDFQVTLAGNRTLGNPTNTQVGKRGRIKVIQDGTGSRTLTKSSNHKTVGGVALTLTTTAAAIDYLDYDCVSATEIRLSLSKAWS
jgi:hypothetical protein